MILMSERCRVRHPTSREPLGAAGSKKVCSLCAGSFKE